MDRYVIFDIDGTLNQTELYAVEAYQKAMKKRGRDLTREEMLACIGLSPAMIVEKLFGSLTDEELKKWRKDIKNYEFELMKDHAAAFDGMKETLQKLRRQGFKLAICSNAFPDHIIHVLEAIHLNGMFDEIGNLTMGENKSEVLRELLKKITPAQACMVGDRRFDILAAADNHIPVIGCAYGYAPKEIKDADYVVQKPVEILDAVREIFR